MEFFVSQTSKMACWVGAKAQCLLSATTVAPSSASRAAQLRPIAPVAPATTDVRLREFLHQYGNTIVSKCRAHEPSQHCGSFPVPSKIRRYLLQTMAWCRYATLLDVSVTSPKGYMVLSLIIYHVGICIFGEAQRF